MPTKNTIKKPVETKAALLEEMKAGVSKTNNKDMERLGACMIAGHLSAKGTPRAAVIANSLALSKEIFNAE